MSASFGILKDRNYALKKELLKLAGEENMGSHRTAESTLQQMVQDTLINIVGTEVDIKLRQEVFKIMDIVNGFGDDNSVSVSSGSLPEGLDMKGSDEDMMLLLKYVDVYLQ